MMKSGAAGGSPVWRRGSARSAAARVFGKPGRSPGWGRAVVVAQALRDCGGSEDDAGRSDDRSILGCGRATAEGEDCEGGEERSRVEEAITLRRVWDHATRRYGTRIQWKVLECPRQGNLPLHLLR